MYPKKAILARLHRAEMLVERAEMCLPFLKNTELKPHLQRTPSFPSLKQLEKDTAAAKDAFSKELLHAREPSFAFRSIASQVMALCGAGLRDVANVERKLRADTFLALEVREWREIHQALSHDIAGTGHWYRCRNGHVYVIADCGMAMESSTCPECGETIGGENHASAAGNTHATDVERVMMGRAQQ
jgi:hypothetical protein